MGRDARAVAHDVGQLLFVPAGMAAVSLPMAVAVGDHHALVPLGVAAVGSATIGGALVHRYRHAQALHRWPAVEVIAIGWLLAGLVTAAVLAGIAHAGPADAADAVFRNPVDALFEGMSGITSTGLTIAEGRESQLSPIVQWWRSLAQWVGGIGVVLFALGVGHTAARVSELYAAEGRSDELAGDVRHTARSMVAIYVALSVATVLAFWATEQDGWTALNHGLTGIATGGFSVTDDSFAGFGTGTLIVAMVAMVLGSITFVAHHLLLVDHDLRAWWRLTPLRAQVLWFSAGFGVLLLVTALGAPDVAVVDVLFQWVSAASTTGFASDAALEAWAPLALVLLVVAIVIGAPSGSTGGGLKLDRAVWLAKDAVRRARGFRGVPPQMSWDGAPVDAEPRRRWVRHAGEMLGLWVLTLAVGTAIMISLTDAPVLQVLFDTASAMSNVGLDADVIDGDLEDGAKLTIAVLMFVGRLELLTALVLASQPERVHGD